MPRLNDKFDIETLLKISEDLGFIQEQILEQNNFNDSPIHRTADDLARITSMLIDVITEDLNGNVNTGDPQHYVLTKLEQIKKLYSK